MARAHLKNIGVLVLISYFFLVFGNGILSLTDPDEVFYVGTARDMQRHGQWLVPYLFGQPQFEKPILLYWLLRFSSILMGPGNFAARFPAALFAVIGVLTVYGLGVLLFGDRRKAFISALALSSCGFYIGMARTVFTDMVFSVLILASLASFYWAFRVPGRKPVGVILFFSFSALATLTKGPLGAAMAFGAAFLFLALRRELRFLRSPCVLWGLCAFCVIAVPWYAYIIQKFGRQFVGEFFYNDHLRRFLEAEHIGNDTWFFYPLYTIACIFPWSLYAAGGLFLLFRRLRRKAEPAYLFLACWILAVFAVFQPAHSKLISYVLPYFPALALCAGNFIGEYGFQAVRPRLFVLLSLLTAVVLFVLPTALVVAAKIYPQYVSFPLPVYVFAAALYALATVFVFLALRRRFLPAMFALAVFLPVMISLVAFTTADAEPFLSSKKTAGFLLRQPGLKNKIICSRMFLRGIWFYTGREVALIDVPGKGFFSPHPVELLNTDDKVMDFLRRQGENYLAVKKHYVDYFRERLGKEFKLEELGVIGETHILRIVRLSPQN